MRMFDPETIERTVDQLADEVLEIDDDDIWRALSGATLPDHPLAVMEELLAKVPTACLDEVDDEDSWRAIVAGMARMAPRHHDGDAKLGRVLARGGITRGELRRLLDSDRDYMRAAVSMISLRLRETMTPLAWRKMALVLFAPQDTDDTGGGSPHDAIAREVRKDYLAFRERNPS